MKDSYWIRLRNVITFFILWIVPGIIISKITGNTEGFMVLVITWLPAIGVTLYLAED